MRNVLLLVYLNACLLLSCSLPGRAQQSPANPTDSIFKDWYYTPTGVSGRIPLTRPKYRSYVKITHISRDLSTIQKYNPAGILINTTYVRLAGGKLSLMTETNRWGDAVDSIWFKPDGDNEFIVTEKIKGKNPSLPCKSLRYSYKDNLLKEIFCLAGATKPGKNQEGVSHYVFERYDDPVRFGLVKTETYYTDIDMPAISNKTDCHKLVNEYDPKGILVSQSLYGPEEKPTLNRYGVFRTKIKYDDDNNEIETDYFDIKGQPTMTTLGYAQVSREYKKGLLETETFYYTDGISIVTSTSLADSVAIINHKYDNDGNETERFYQDPSKYPTKNANGIERTVFYYSPEGMLIRMANFGPGPTPREKERPGYRIERDPKGRATALTFANTAGILLRNKDEGAFIIRYAYDNWGRITSTTFWQNDSVRMLGSEGHFERSNRYNDDGQVIEVDNYNENGKFTKGSIGYSRELIGYNEQGLVAERNYFDGDLPAIILDSRVYVSHFHRVVYNYDFYNRVRSLEFYDNAGRPINATLHIRKESKIDGQRIDFSYEGPVLLKETIRDSGDIYSPVTLDCPRGKCLPVSLLDSLQNIVPGESQVEKKAYHGSIAADSLLYDHQLAFICRDSVLLFLGFSAGGLSATDCADFYRVARINKYFQLDGTVTDYYLENDSVAALFPYRSGLLTGLATLYYKNGKVKEEGEYLKNSKVGIWNYYYDNGTQAKTIDFSEKGPLLLECYAEDGRILAQNGNGRFEGMVISNSLQNQMEYRVSGNIKDGLPDGEWKLYNQYFSGTTNIELFSSGKFKHGTSFSFTGKKDYSDKIFSRVESIHGYEHSDYYSQSPFCKVGGFHTVLQNLFPEIRAGFAQILKTNKYKDYSGWILLDVKIDSNGQVIDANTRLYQQNDKFEKDILDMAYQLPYLPVVYKNEQGGPYEKFYIILVEANDVVIPAELLARQRTIIH